MFSRNVARKPRPFVGVCVTPLPVVFLLSTADALRLMSQRCSWPTAMRLRDNENATTIPARLTIPRPRLPVNLSAKVLRTTAWPSPARLPESFAELSIRDPEPDYLRVPPQSLRVQQPVWR